MAKANGSLSPHSPSIYVATAGPNSFEDEMKISDSFAINVLMRREAILAVKDKLKRQGQRVCLIRTAEIHRLARDYLAENQDELYLIAARKWEAINAGNRGRSQVASASPVRSASGA